MAFKNSKVQSLQNLGADAMDNFYDLAIAPPSILDFDITAEWELRADGFNPPEFKVAPFQTQYKSTFVDMMDTKITGKREFDITFRIDKYYSIWKMLLKWRSLTYTPSISHVTPGKNGNNDLLGTIKLIGNSNIMKFGSTKELNTVVEASWEFKKVRCIFVTEPKYTVGDGSALSVTATFQFINHSHPETDNNPYIDTYQDPTN